MSSSLPYMHRHIKLLSIEETTSSWRDECEEKARIHGLGRLTLQGRCGRNQHFCEMLAKILEAVIKSMACLGGCPEWLKGQTVNLLAYAYAGSNPASSTRQTHGLQMESLPGGSSSMVEP